MIFSDKDTVDLEKKTKSFPYHFENRLFKQTNGEYTFILSMNAYDGFVQLLQAYCGASEDFMWFYVKDSKDEPKIPRKLQRFYKPIDINRIR